jgi:hypothetical protein
VIAGHMGIAAEGVADQNRVVFLLVGSAVCRPYVS